VEICFETIKLDMEKLKKAFVYGLIVTVVINGFGFFVNVNLNGYDEALKDILYIRTNKFFNLFCALFFFFSIL
jgi:hypothetical protein